MGPNLSISIPIPNFSLPGTGPPTVYPGGPQPVPAPMHNAASPQLAGSLVGCGAGCAPQLKDASGFTIPPWLKVAGFLAMGGLVAWVAFSGDGTRDRGKLEYER